MNVRLEQVVLSRYRELATESLNHLTDEEVQQLKYHLWTQQTTMALDATPVAQRLVAEGDSWFDYPVGLDVLDHLKGFGYAIFKVADHGDTLENMVYGTEYKGNFSRQKPSIEQTLEAVVKYQLRVVLFSGGGNDLAGPELESLLNHADAQLQTLIRTEATAYLFGTVIPTAYRHFIRRVREKAPAAHIITHGYGNTIPDGRSVRKFGIRFAGPWLRPGLTKKNITDATKAREIMRELVKAFNDTLATIATAHPGYVHPSTCATSSRIPIGRTSSIWITTRSGASQNNFTRKSKRVSLARAHDFHSDVPLETSAAELQVGYPSAPLVVPVRHDSSRGHLGCSVSSCSTPSYAFGSSFRRPNQRERGADAVRRWTADSRSLDT